MPFPWLAAATIGAAGLGMAGSIAGGAQSAKAQKETNEFNREMAREQMAFQERMDSTRFQRGKADALAAGFNPLLATGSPAGTPMGSAAHALNPKPNRGELFLATAKAVADTMLVKEQVKTEQTKQELNRAETNARTSGTVSIPGFVSNVPINSVAGKLKNPFSFNPTQYVANSTAKQIKNKYRS